jgi:hypothetical protein
MTLVPTWSPVKHSSAAPTLRRNRWLAWVFLAVACSQAPKSGDGDNAAGSAESACVCAEGCEGPNVEGDVDGDGVCDVDDLCPDADDGLDGDGDLVPDGCDACPGHPDDVDQDADAVPDACDLCAGDDASGDSDVDGVCDSDDLCDGASDGDDADLDGVPDGCDACEGDDATGDADLDGTCDDLDPCIGTGPDADLDGFCDNRDLCPDFDDGLDDDLDGIPDDCDGCEGHDDLADSDADGSPDGCDLCDGDDLSGDRDADGVCDASDGCPLDPYETAPPCSSLELLVSVTDLAPESNFQGVVDASHMRGRATVVADFDLDGYPDVFSGNPRDTSMILRNVPGDGAGRSFEVAQVVLEGALAWGAASADYDNDGDYDLFISGGGNEGPAPDILLQNQFIETGELWFVDVTEEAGVEGWWHEGEERIVWAASANAVWGDVDSDGDVDLFVNANTKTTRANLPRWAGRNTLWSNDGDGTFTDVTVEAGLDRSLLATRHSTFVDIDNDGDLDLYENNHRGFNRMWRNLHAETGRATFVDVAEALAGPDLAAIAAPSRSFASCAEDFDNDGWQDIIVFHRGAEDCSGAIFDEGPLEALGAGHALYLNQAGEGFVNHATPSGLNDHALTNSSDTGVMGCQIGDLNNDGLMDVFLGNGGPRRGQVNHLFLSTPGADGKPDYLRASPLIDFPAPDVGLTDWFAPYPYRTHGTSMVDFDADGHLEIAVTNGGPAYMEEWVREPNRLFSFDWAFETSWLSVRPVGDGERVSMDGIGTRMALTLRRADGSTFTVHRTLFGGSCFSGQNGFAVHFGLADAVAIDGLHVLWPDGSTTDHEVPEMNRAIVVTL